MSRVDFYILPDKGPINRFVCKIAGKVHQQGCDLHIHTRSKEEALSLDDLLWTYKDTSFLPHAINEDADIETTPISIGWPGTPHRQKKILFNLCPEVPDFIDDYERIVEIVPPEATSRKQARERYRHYRDLGFDMHNHELEPEHVAT